jgi:hypothetical protein
MPTEKQEIALLRILIATSERALEAFQAMGNPVDEEFVRDLERILERSRRELVAFVDQFAKPS